MEIALNNRSSRRAAKATGPLGVPNEAVALFRNGTPPNLPPWRFAKSLAEVGKTFGVAERTAAAWKAAGMPGRDEEFGVYRIDAIHDWKRTRPDAPSWHFQRNPNLCDLTATGDLLRTVFVEYRHGLPSAVAQAINELRDHLTEELAILVAAAMAKHIGPLLLSDDAIEHRLERDWDNV